MKETLEALSCKRGRGRKLGTWSHKRRAPPETRSMMVPRYSMSPSLLCHVALTQTSHASGILSSLFPSTILPLSPFRLRTASLLLIRLLLLPHTFGDHSLYNPIFPPLFVILAFDSPLLCAGEWLRDRSHVARAPRGRRSRTSSSSGRSPCTTRTPRIAGRMWHEPWEGRPWTRSSDTTSSWSRTSSSSSRTGYHTHITSPPAAGPAALMRSRGRSTFRFPPPSSDRIFFGFLFSLSLFSGVEILAITRQLDVWGPCRKLPSLDLLGLFTDPSSSPLSVLLFSQKIQWL